MNFLVAVPAYGRDYQTAEQVRADWAKGRDFCCWPQGSYINKEDADNFGITVQLRFLEETHAIVIEPEMD